MSYLTRRERVFDEPNLKEIPPRNEGKLKAYNSCTDTRAWSHHRSNQSEHLFEIIRRNTGKCMKFIPLDVIVNTLTGAKNAEIERLKKLVDELKKILACYEALDLTPEQRALLNQLRGGVATVAAKLSFAQDEAKADTSEILGVNAEGDNQGYPESGPESGTEAYETGVSQADSNECPESCPGWDDIDEQICDPCDKITDARVPEDEYGSSIEDLHNLITQKDAELAAKANAIAILESVVYEPYCIYARIYTFMEKLLAILKQHPKYKIFLDELTNANRFSITDIKAKIFWKLKILERFCETLTYSCQSEINTPVVGGCDTECYFAQLQILNPIGETFESNIPCNSSTCESIKNINEHRQSLVDEIIKTSNDNNKYHDDLHKLRHSYDLLLEQFNDIKDERDTLEDRVNHYVDVENELEDLRLKLQDYSLIWNQKEHYKRRSNEIEGLTSQYMTEIAETFEEQLKAEHKISNMRGEKITELVDENTRLQTEMSALGIEQERTKKSLQRKVQDLEGQLILQQEEVKRLTLQCDDNLSAHKQQIISENNDLKRQIANLKSFLETNEKEKQTHVEDIKKQQSVIHCLQEEFKRCEDKYMKQNESNDELEKYAIGWKREASKEKDTKQELLLQIQQLNILRRKAEEQVKQAEIEKESILLHVDDPQHVIEDLLNKCKRLEDELNDRKESRGIVAGQSLFPEVEQKDDGSVRASITEWMARNMELENVRGESEDSYSQKHEIQDFKNQLENLQNYSTDLNVKEQLQVKENLLETVRIEFSNMRDDYNKLLNENKKLKKISNTLQNQAQAQMIQIENLVRARDTIQESLTRSEQENNESLSKLKQCNGKTEDLEKSLQEAELELSELKYAFDREESEKDNIVHKDSDKIAHASNYDDEKLQEVKIPLQSQTQEQLEKNNQLHIQLKEVENSRSKLEQTLKISEKDTIVHKDSDKIAHDSNYDDEKLQEVKIPLQSQTQEKLEQINQLHIQLKEVENSRSKLEQTLKISEKDTIVHKDSDKIAHDSNYNDEKLQEVKIPLQSQTQEQLEQINQLHIQLKEVENSRSKLEHNLKISEKDTSDRSLESKKLRAENDELRKKMCDAENRLSSIKRSLDEQVSEKDLIVKRALIERFSMEKTSSHLLERNKELEDTVEHLDREVRSNTALNEMTSLEINLILQDVNELKLEKTQNEDKINLLSRQLDAAVKVSNDQMAEVEEFKNHIGELENIILMSDERKKKIHDRLHDKEKELETILAKFKISEGENDQLRKESLKLKKIHSMLNKQIQNQNQEIESLRKGIGEVINSKDCIQKAFINSEDEKHILKTQNEKILSEKLSLQKDMEALKEDMDHLIKNNEELETARDESQNKIQKAEKEKLEAVTKFNVLETEYENIKKRLSVAENEDYQLKWKEAEKKQMSLEMLIQAEKKDIQILRKQLEDLGQAKHDIEDLLNIVEIEKKDALAKCDLLETDKGNLHGKFQISNSEIYENTPKSLSEIKYVPERDAQLNSENTSFEDDRYKELEKMVDDLTNQVKLNEIKERKTDDLYDELIKNINLLELEKNKKEDEINGLRIKLQIAENKLEKQTKELNDKEESIQNLRISIERLENELDVIIENSVSEDTGVEAQISGGRDLESVAVEVAESPAIYNIRKEFQELNSRSKKEQKHTGKLKEIIENSWHTPKPDQRKSKDEGNTSNTMSNVSKEAIGHQPNGNQNLIKENEQLIKDKKILEDQVELYKSQLVTLESDMNNQKELFNIEKDNLEEYKKLEHQVDLYQIQLYELNQQKKIVEELNRSLANQITELKNELSYMNKLYNNALDEIQQLKEEKSLSYTSIQSSYDNGSDKIEQLKNDKADLLSATYDSLPQNVELLSHNIDQLPRQMTSIYKPTSVEKEKSKIMGLELKKESISEPINELSEIKFLYKNALNEIENLKKQSKGIRKNSQHLNGESNPNLIEQKEGSGESLIGTYEYNNSIHQNSITHEDGDLRYTEVENKVQSEILRDYENKIKKLEKNLELAESHFNNRMENMKFQYDKKYLDTINHHMRGVKRLESIYEDTISDMIQMHVDDVDKLRCESVENNLRVLKLDKENRAMKSSFTQVETALDKIINDSYEFGEAIRTLHVGKSRCGMRCLMRSKVLMLEIRPVRRGRGNGGQRGARTCPCWSSANVNLFNRFRGLAHDQKKVAEENYVRSLACKLIDGNPETLDQEELSYLHSKICHIWRSKKGKDEMFQRRIAAIERNLMKKQKYTSEKITELDDLTRKVRGQRVESRTFTEEGRRCACTSRRVKTPN